MLVLEVLLVAVVLALAAVAAAGRTGELADAPPDRAYEGLPGGGPVTSADVSRLRLDVAMRGYRMAEVDEVLARLAEELDERDARIAALECRPAGPVASSLGGAPGRQPAADGPQAAPPPSAVPRVVLD